MERSRESQASQRECVCVCVFVCGVVRFNKPVVASSLSFCSLTVVNERHVCAHVCVWCVCVCVCVYVCVGERCRAEQVMGRRRFFGSRQSGPSSFFFAWTRFGHKMAVYRFLKKLSDQLFTIFFLLSVSFSSLSNGFFYPISPGFSKLFASFGWWNQICVPIFSSWLCLFSFRGAVEPVAAGRPCLFFFFSLLFFSSLQNGCWFSTCCISSCTSTVKLDSMDWLFFCWLFLKLIEWDRFWKMWNFFSVPFGLSLISLDFFCFSFNLIFFFGLHWIRVWFSPTLKNERKIVLAPPQIG